MPHSIRYFHILNTPPSNRVTHLIKQIERQTNNQHFQVLSKICTFYFTQDQKYTEQVFRFINRWQLVQNTGSLDLTNKILVGFDTDGTYLEAVKLMGIEKVQIGPVSLSSEDSIGTMGILYTKANILSFLDSQQEKMGKKLSVGINLVPDSQVELYAPYIIPENMLKAAEIITELCNNNEQQKERTQSDLQVKIVDFITINSQQISNKLGQQNQKQVNEIIKIALKEIINKVAVHKNLTIYENKKDAIYQRFPKDKKCADGTFITWKDIVAEIIKE